jgi:hypothetical protein
MRPLQPITHEDLCDDEARELIARAQELAAEDAAEITYLRTLAYWLRARNEVQRLDGVCAEWDGRDVWREGCWSDVHNLDARSEWRKREAAEAAHLRNALAAVAPQGCA